jgi:hypothetical protein
MEKKDERPFGGGALRIGGGNVEEIVHMIGNRVAERQSVH